MEQTQQIEIRKEAKDFVQVGDILNTCWGYDQTNVEFFKVTKIIGKRFIALRRLKAAVQETGFMCGNSTPTETETDEEIKAHVATDGYIKESTLGYRRTLWKWDGKPQGVSWYG